MSSSSDVIDSTQKTVLESQIDNMDFESIWEEAISEVSDHSERTEVEEQFRILGVSLSVQKTLRDKRIETIERGGGAVRNYLMDEVGGEALTTWRGTGDADLNVMPEYRERNIPEAVNSKYIPPTSHGRDDTVTESSNSRHEGKKYTVRLNSPGDEEVELDIMQPKPSDEHEFNYDALEKMEIAGTKTLVPKLEEVFISKLDTYVSDNRDKDVADMANLLYVQQQRNRRNETQISPRDLYEMCDESGLAEEYKDVLDEIEDRIPHAKAEGNYFPDEEYLDF